MAGIGTSSTCQAVHELPQEEIKRLLGALKKKALISREYGRALVLLKFLLALKTTLQRHPRHKSGRLNEVELQQKLFSQEDAKGERLIEKAKKIILDTIKAGQVHPKIRRLTVDRSGDDPTKLPPWSNDRPRFEIPAARPLRGHRDCCRWHKPFPALPSSGSAKTCSLQRN